MLNKLLSPREVADILGVSTTTLAIWRCHGSQELSYIKVGRKVMYKPEEVERFIFNRTVEIRDDSI